MVSKKELIWLKHDCPNCGEKEIARLGRGEPIDYIIGWKEFLGCKIDLSARPLIPRAETEFWVEQAIKAVAKDCPWKTKGQSLAILDLFSGSGCIGLAVQKHLPNAKVTFGDLYPINQRTIKTNIFSNISGKFDIIFANPPYIPTQKSKVSKSVKNWEPKKALYAGKDGLAIIKKFLKQAKDHLKLGGRIYLEFGYGQKLAITKLLKDFNYSNWQFHRDQFGKWRWVVIE